MLETVVRGPAGALARMASRLRSLRTRVTALVRRGRATGSDRGSAPQPDPENAAFLNEVSETLRRIETSGDREAPSPGPAPGGGRLRSAAVWLARLREGIRRKEDALLAAAILLGILVMVAHWRLSGDVHVPLRGQRMGAAATRPADGANREPPPPPNARPGDVDVDAAGGGRTGSPR